MLLHHLLGHVSVTELNAQGHPTVTNYLGPGRQFGEIGLLSRPFGIHGGFPLCFPPEKQGMRTATCTALDHVELVSIPRFGVFGHAQSLSRGERPLEKAACEM